MRTVLSLTATFLALISVAAVTAPPAPATPSTPPAPAPAVADSIPKLSLQRVLPELPLLRPVQVVFEPGNDERMYIVEQPGQVLIANPNDAATTEAKIFLDMRAQVNSQGNEEGLLSLVFHPKYAQNHNVLTYYTAFKAPRKRVSRLSRWTVDPVRGTVKPDSEELLLEVDQPFSNHNGGTALFGPDGMLYLSMGDGGAADDPLKSGQDLGTLLAKVIRIDVDKPQGERKYTVPADNPFVTTEGARPEVWAYGLRNIWRMSFDRKTGELYGGDVGQNLYEEVDIIRKGGNYGWNVREGLHAFRSGTPGKYGSDYIDPIAEYPRDQGVSITGGYVYRGTRHPQLDGVYLYADLVSCRIWGLRTKDGALSAGPKQIAQTRGQLPTSFGEANDGTLYLVTFEGSQSSNAKGAIWRIGCAAQ